jgi:hypothetical protein
MTDKLIKRNRSLEKYDELASDPKEEVIDYSNPVEPVIVAIEENDSDAGGVGTAALSVEKLSAIFNEAQNKAFNENRRRYEGQGKFGPGSFVEKNSSSSNGFGETLLSHPLLEETQYFSGIDSALSPNPTENPEAYEKFLQKRLEYQRRLQKNLGLDASASKNITLAR